MPAVSQDDTAGRAAPATLPATSGLPDAGLRLLAVHAHPDDESSKGAATMVRYARFGADVMVATLTGGERGDILACLGHGYSLPALRTGEVRMEPAWPHGVLGAFMALG